MKEIIKMIEKNEYFIIIIKKKICDYLKMKKSFKN